MFDCLLKSNKTRGDGESFKVLTVTMYLPSGVFYEVPRVHYLHICKFFAPSSGRDMMNYRLNNIDEKVGLYQMSVLFRRHASKNSIA